MTPLDGDARRRRPRALSTAVERQPILSPRQGRSGKGLASDIHPDAAMASLFRGMGDILT